MKTAMQELKERMYLIGLEGIDEFIDPYIEKEKQQIIDAYKAAEDKSEFFEYEHRYGREYLTAEPYYDKTFS